MIPTLVCHTMKYGRYAIMLWGAIKGDGSLALIKCPIKLNSGGYQNVLESGLVELYGDIFMQNNVLCHKSASTLAYLEKKNVCLLSDWPPQSSDLNIIENLWATLKKKVTARCPRNACELCPLQRRNAKLFRILPCSTCMPQFLST